MRAELANVNNCVVPFLSRTAASYVGITIHDIQNFMPFIAPMKLSRGIELVFFVPYAGLVENKMHILQCAQHTFNTIYMNIPEPEILGNHNINTGTTLLSKTIVN